MKKLAILFLGIFFAVTFCSAQDLIIRKSGIEIKAKVIEISQSEVKFKRFDNLNGPVLIMPVSDILMIRYENGTNEIFGQDQEKSAETPAQKSEVDNSVAGLALSVNFLGVVQFGPIINLEYGITDNLVLNTHVRLFPYGVLSYTVLESDGDVPDKLTGIGVGGGLIYFFGEKTSRPYLGGLLEYHTSDALYDQNSSWEWREVHDRMVIIANGGYRVRFKGGFFINTGAYLGVSAGKYDWFYTDDPNSGEKDVSNLVPFGMLEVTLGIQF